MGNLRQRKLVPGKSVSHTNQRNVNKRNGDENESLDKPFGKYLPVISSVFGAMLCVYIGYKYSGYMETIHENNLWFTNIKEVEREISFRTESGLYYSYYKQFVKAPTIAKGVYDLTHDRVTEHLRTINILERFNVYQELVLGMVHKVFQVKLEPVYFYLRTVWGLHGILVGALYCMAWLLSGSWLAGVLTGFLYIFNRYDTTRAEYVVPLRESWSLPFLWIQQLIFTYYFKRHVPTKHWPSIVGLVISTFCFNITWQFTQFVLLLQAMALFGVWSLGFIPKAKIQIVLVVQLISLFSVCLLQFWNAMILGSLVLSFIPAAFLVMNISEKLQLKKKGIVIAIISVIFEVIAVLTAMILISKLIKASINLQDDEHIFKFVLTKLGLAKYRDFDVQLYLCNGAFTKLTPDVFERMTAGFVFPIYTMVHVMLLISLAVAVIQLWRTFGSDSTETSKNLEEKDNNQHIFKNRPELTFHTVQCTLFGILAFSTLRMKYLWTPYMCVLASFGLADYTIWRWILNITTRRKTSEFLIQCVRHAVTGLVIAALVQTHLPPALENLKELKEFYDPDTVELMEWINKSVPKRAAFTGSMQLLAGVKLCTGRPLTNHPHYEDKVLRTRTKELYKMYGKFSPAEVYQTMVKYNTSYVILEDSICLAPKKGDACRLPDIVDITYGIEPDYQPDEKIEGLKKANVPHFCDEIRHGRPPYSDYFKLVFRNKTFRVYHVLPNVSNR